MSDSHSNIIRLGHLIPELKNGNRTFAESLYNQFQSKGRLSDKQWHFVEKIIQDFESQGDKRQQAVANAKQVDNFERVIEIFDFAKEKGYKKKPKLRLGDKETAISLSPAPDSGVNAGMVYVQVNGEYYGKISREGKWIVASGKSSDNLIEKLSEFSMAPSEIAKRYGFSTGECCVCGRKLTDKTSIKMGIGPICADGWGL